MSRADVVIVGGGIAGSALATALARDGSSVTVLEASEEYEDRVRGETMVPWGVAEARALGVEQALLDAGAQVDPGMGRLPRRHRSGRGRGGARSRSATWCRASRGA